MKSNLFVIYTTIALVASLLSQVVLAHPGHDHSAANSSLIHLLWLAPIAIAVALYYRRKVTLTKNNSKEDQA